MPVGLYTRKGKNGRTMYFRDGKLISKKSYTASRNRRGATRKGRAPYRGKRSTGNPRRKNMARRMTIPHPSITGMASGLAVANYLNQGTAVGIGTMKTGGVIADALGGNLNLAFTELSRNAVDLATSPGGKAVLSSAIVLATAGGIARKWFPSVKLGGTKLYFKI